MGIQQTESQTSRYQRWVIWMQFAELVSELKEN